MYIFVIVISRKFTVYYYLYKGLVIPFDKQNLQIKSSQLNIRKIAATAKQKGHRVSGNIRKVLRMER